MGFRVTPPPPPRRAIFFPPCRIARTRPCHAQSGRLHCPAARALPSCARVSAAEMDLEAHNDAYHESEKFVDDQLALQQMQLQQQVRDAVPWSWGDEGRRGGVDGGGGRGVW